MMALVQHTKENGTSALLASRRHRVRTLCQLRAVSCVQGWSD